MAEAQRKYPYSSVQLYNLACDIVEMYKARITEDKAGRFGFTTEMYGQSTEYLFRIERQEGKCLLSIKTGGEDEQSGKQLTFMFSIVDNMLAQLPGVN